MEHLGVSSETIDISPWPSWLSRRSATPPSASNCRELDVESFRAALAQVPREAASDLTFENVQARLRTFLLMSQGVRHRHRRPLGDWPWAGRPITPIT